MFFRKMTCFNSFIEFSPAINAGNNDFYPDTWTKWSTNISATLITQAEYTQWVLPALEKDLDGNERIKGGTIDMGAYEWQ